MAMQHQYDGYKSDLIVSVVPELQKRIAEAAAQSNLSVEEYIESILEQVVPPRIHSAQKRDGRLSRAAVEELKQYREETRRAHPEQVFEDPVELLWQAREERTRELE